jgi:putative DNA primase/helicase
MQNNNVKMETPPIDDQLEASFVQLEPWPTSVQGSALLNALSETIQHHVVLEKGAAETVALWTLHTHAIDAFAITPRLVISSVVPRCGKTTLLDIQGRLVRRPLTTVNATAAAIFRVVDAVQPTLLIDEADTFLGKTSDMRGIINSGYRRNSAYVIRVDGRYSTWAAVAIAMIGRPPATIEDRAISVRMKRRRQDEKIVPLRLDRMDQFTPLARMCARWAADNIDQLINCDPTMPICLQNREADNWRPLLAIADAAGGDWPDRARKIAELIALSNRSTEQSAGIVLLCDIFQFFGDQSVHRASSSELAVFLAGLDGRPWADWKAGKPITPRSIANLLAPFNIVPSEMRVGQQVLRGYHRAQFEDAFARYVGNSDS